MTMSLRYTVLVLCLAACSGSSANPPDANPRLPDADVRQPDADVRQPDAAVAVPDAAVVLPPDAAVVLPPDAAAPLPDAAVVLPPDAAAPLPDAAVVLPPDAAAGCGPDVSFSAEVQPIFTAKCATSGCHDGSVALAVLTPAQAYVDLVNIDAVECSNPNRKLVAPGLPDDSYLMHKVLGVNMCLGSRMPRFQPALLNSEIELIRAWICHGALDN